jgi:RHS repeat-associated protein
VLSTYLALSPAPASAEPTCTNTWAGSETGGNWQTVANWSAGHVPTSSDVVCLGEASVEVTEGTNHAGLVESAPFGGVELTGGSLELNGTSAPSTLGAFLIKGGALAVVSGAKMALNLVKIDGGSASIGAHAELTYHEIIMSSGSMSLGASTTLGSLDFLSVEAGATFESGGETTIDTHELVVEGLFADAGTVTSHYLAAKAGTLSGKIVTDEAYLGSSASHAKLEGTLTITHFGLIRALDMANSALLENKAETYVYEDAGGAVIRAVSGAPRIINTGEFWASGPGTSTVEPGFENLGQIVEYEGQFAFSTPVLGDPSKTWGPPKNPSAPELVHPTCGDPVSCATGNLYEAQPDFSIGGRGVGLALTRTYNSQAGASGEHGAFGYGWTASFGEHIVHGAHCEGLICIGALTVHQDDGSTVEFLGNSSPYSAPTWTQDTLTGSEGSGYTLTLANQTKYHFAGAGPGASGRLETVTDRNGNATSLTYDGSGRLEAVTDPAGRSITLTYNGEGLIEQAKDPMGHVVKYAYEGGNLATVTEPGETEPRWQFKYDGAHQLTELIDGRGGRTINGYNEAHQVVSQTDPLKHLLTFAYRAFETIITNHATGSVTDERFRSDAEPTVITRGFGTSSATSESLSYDDSSRVLSTTDGNEHKTEYGYDAAGNRIKIVDADGNETKWTYNETHDVLTTTTPTGETTTVKRDSKGNAESVSRPAPGSTTQTTNYKYDTHGALTSIEDPLKRIWKYEYNAQGDRISEIDPEGDKRTWSYNLNSQETSTVSPRGVAAGGTKEAKYKTTTERDAQGRATLVIAPLKHETKYNYDRDGNLEARTDPELNKTTYTYDADNEPIKVEEPNKTITETGYDGSGRVSSQTDGNKHTTTYLRNILGEVTEVIDPLSRKTIKEYDAAGNLTHLVDATKRTTTYKYDDANRLTEVSYSDGKTPKAKYEYDADGDRTKMVDGTGTSTYTYDQLDRLTEAKDGHGDVSGYEYDLANQQTKITYPNGKAVVRTFDSSGRLKSVTDWLEHTTNFVYDADSDQTGTTFPISSSNFDSYGYDEAGHMSEVRMAQGLETLASVVYARNKDGGVTKATTKGLPGEEIAAFAYDVNSRLAKGAGVAYKYDAADDPTKLGPATYSYDAASQLEKGTGATYNYDSLGERTKTIPASGPATTYAYDQAGNLTSIVRPHEGEGGAIEDIYSYDGNGLRASQTISGATAQLAWDISGEVPMLVEDGSNSYIYGPAGLPVEQVAVSGTVTYLHHDQAGSTRLLTGSTGTVTGRSTFDAYGNKTGSTGTSTTPLGYDGQYTSSDTGLIYLRARTYDPATAQFMSVDPLAPVTLALYSYVGDNPLNFSDPSGLIFGIPGTPSWEEAGEAIAGWGDTLTLGATNWVREELGINNVNPCSTAYQVGGYAGLASAALIPGEGEGELAAEGVDEAAGAASEFGSTPRGRPFTKHYGQDTGPKRNIPGSVVDQAIDENPGVPGRDGTTVHYDPNNEVTVVTGRNGGIVSARRGEP